MRNYLLVFCLLVMAAGLRAADLPLPFLAGQAYHILPSTHNQEASAFSLCEGLDGELYVGTAKNGSDSFLVELDPNTGRQRVVIDTHKICSYAGSGYAAQAGIDTRNFVATSGRIYAGSAPGERGKDENAWSYPGGFLMSYDPRTETPQSYGTIPCRGSGVADIAADETNNRIYYICREPNTGDCQWGVYETREKLFRLLGPHVSPDTGTLIGEGNHAYVLTSDGKLACYDPIYDQLTQHDLLLNGKPFSPAAHFAAWALAPDGKSAYLLCTPALYRVDLASAAVTDLGKMATFDMAASFHGTLAVHPDGNVYALMTIVDPNLRAKGLLNVLARYEPATNTMHTLGALAIRNKDYFDFSKPFCDGVETLPDGTLAPIAARGMIASRDGALYVLLNSPLAVLKIDDFRVTPPATPSRLWTDVTLQQCDRIEKNLPEITRIAEAVAQRYIAGGRLDVILNSNNGWPGQGPQAEISGRSGGMIDLGGRYVPDEEDLTRPAADRANDVIIIGWQRAPTPGDVERIKLYKGRGTKILGFGPHGLPELAECEKLCDYWIDTGYGADDHAVTLEDGRRVGHGNSLANLLGAWTFMGEFVGALTRQGKMPPMWKAMLWANDWEPWFKKYGGKFRFHEDLYVPPLAQGELGAHFLNQIRWHLRAFRNTQLDQVQKAAGLIVEEHAKGKKTVVTVAGHCMFDTVGKYEDGAWAHEISFHGWVPYETRAYIAQAPRDALVLVLAYCGFHKEQWSTFVGAGQNRLLLVTSENDSQQFPALDGPHDECLAIISMGHAFGDACTRIDGYPFPVFPPSGIMQCVAYEAVDVEVMAKIGKEAGK